MKTDLVVRPAHLQLALNCANNTFVDLVEKGRIPPPDGRGVGSLKLWKLETIRAWNPDVADSIEQLLKIPAFAPRPHRVLTPLLMKAA